MPESGECYVKKDGEIVELRGKVLRENPGSFYAVLTAEDLEMLFDIKFGYDYISGKAKINKQEHK